MPVLTGRHVTRRQMLWNPFAVLGAIFAAVGLPMLAVGLVMLLYVGEWGGLIFLAIGAVFSVLGLSFVITQRRRVARRMWLRDNGEAQQATVAALQMSGVTVNNSKLHFLILDLDGTPHQTGLHHLHELMGYPAGMPVTVYVNPSDPSEMVWEGDCGLPDPAAGRAYGREDRNSGAEPDVGRPKENVAPTVRRR